MQSIGDHRIRIGFPPTIAAGSRSWRSPHRSREAFLSCHPERNRRISNYFYENPNKAERSNKTNSKKEEYMRTSFCLLALTPFVFASCVEEVPVTTTTTEVTRTVTTGPTTREVVVTEAPPPVRVETRTVAPGPGYVWTSGYWRWTGAGYQWVPGSWIVRPRPAAIWVEGHWVRRAGGWIWVAGHWQ